MAIIIPGVLREGRGKELLDRARTLVRTVRNALMWVVARSDYRRWTSADGLEEWWSARTDIIAQFVPPDSRVIEFGAGRRHLEECLPLGCTYTPLDLVDRGPRSSITSIAAPSGSARPRVHGRRVRGVLDTSGRRRS
jgi:hypothetical protein